MIWDTCSNTQIVVNISSVDKTTSQLLHLYYNPGSIVKEYLGISLVPEYQADFCEAISPGSGSINKARTMTVSTDMLIWKGRNFTGSYS